MVEAISSSDEDAGRSVPMPAAPVVGKVLVCENEILVKKIPVATRKQKKKPYLIIGFFEETKNEHRKMKKIFYAKRFKPGLA